VLAEADAGTAGAFEVQVGADGPVLPVAAGVPLLDVLLEAGVDIEWSCREGTCGTCETRVLSGDLDHRDSVLTPGEREAGDFMMPCVSRGNGRVVLDVRA
jgi:ferredoxin